MYSTCGTTKGGFRPPFVLVMDQVPDRYAEGRRINLPTVVPAVPAATGFPTEKMLIIGLLVVGISRFLVLARSVRTALNRVICVAELLARGYGRTAHVMLGRCCHLNRRSGNQQRAENG
jgi:hypothetical protein